MAASDARAGTQGGPAVAATALVDAFECACRGTVAAAGTRLRMAGALIDVRIIGHRLARETIRPFAHLVDHSSVLEPPALSIDLWDESETGVSCPVEAHAFDRASLTWFTEGAEFAVSAGGRYLGFRHGGSISVFDRGSRRIVGCRASTSEMSGNARVKPLAVHLATWLADRGVNELHAALVGRCGVGALLAGVSGAGKSTSAMACAWSGLDYLGDDIVGLEAMSDGSFVGHSLFGGVCLDQMDFQRFDVPAERVVEAVKVGGKMCLFPFELHAERVKRGLPLGAVLLLRVGVESTSRLRPARKSDVLLTLALSSLGAVVPRPGAAAMTAIGRLVDRVPGYWLDLGREILDTPRVIGELLANLVAA